MYEPKAIRKKKSSPKLSLALIDNDCHNPSFGLVIKARA